MQAWGRIKAYLEIGNSTIHLLSLKLAELNTRFFVSNVSFSNQPRCCLTSSWIEVQILLRCCWTNVSTVKLRHFSYLLYLRLCLDEDLFMSYHCHLFLIFIFIFIMINLMILSTDMYVSLLVFYNMSYCFGW